MNNEHIESLEEALECAQAELEEANECGDLEDRLAIAQSIAELEARLFRARLQSTGSA